jgi:hypothetical protein
MSDRFPYNLPSREALVELVRRSTNRPDLKDEYVTFEDLFFSPTIVEPGRTSIEMIDRVTSQKEWFEFRRLELSNNRCLGPLVSIKIMGDPTPANIAAEINRSRKMKFGPSDVSFSDELIPVMGTTFEYIMPALSGSYVFYGSTKVQVEVLPISQWTRYLENGAIRYTQEGVARELEHRINRWS